MERIPEYCKVGLLTSFFTVTNALTYGLLIAYPLAIPVAIGCKAFLVAFPVVGLGITMKKMYDYHKAPPNAGHQVPSHDD
jgi:hypothetical protein